MLIKVTLMFFVILATGDFRGEYDTPENSAETSVEKSWTDFQVCKNKKVEYFIFLSITMNKTMV